MEYLKKYLEMNGLAPFKVRALAEEYVNYMGGIGSLSTNRVVGSFTRILNILIEKDSIKRVSIGYYAPLPKVIEVINELLIAQNTPLTRSIFTKATRKRNKLYLNFLRSYMSRKDQFTIKELTDAFNADILIHIKSDMNNTERYRKAQSIFRGIIVNLLKNGLIEKGEHHTYKVSTKTIDELNLTIKD